MQGFILLIIILLVVCSAFFSGAETAFTTISKYKIKKIIMTGNAQKEILFKWLSSPQFLLTSLLVGNTVVNLMISFFATLFIVREFSSIFGRGLSEFIAWLVTTFGVIIFCELIPKIYSRNTPEYVIIKVVKPLIAINKILSPVVNPIIFLLKKLIPENEQIPAGRIGLLTREELENIIVDSQNRGILHADTSRMLEGIIKINKMRVSEIMTPLEKIDSVDISQFNISPDNVIEKLIETGRSRIPVHYGDINKIAGIVLYKDLAEVKDINTIIRPAYFVDEDKNTGELLIEFQQGITHCAIVLDKNKNVVGLITLEDIVKEIIGEILDKYEMMVKNK